MIAIVTIGEKKYSGISVKNYANWNGYWSGDSQSIEKAKDSVYNGKYVYSKAGIYKVTLSDSNGNIIDTKNIKAVENTDASTMYKYSYVIS